MDPIVKKITDNRNKIEIGLTALTLGLLLVSHVAHMGAVLIISFFLLAIFYFLRAFAAVQTEALYGAMALKICNIGSSVAVIGYGFHFQRMEGDLQLMMIGLLSVAASMVLLLYFFATSKNKEYLVLLIRGLAILLIVGSEYLHESGVL